MKGSPSQQIERPHVLLQSSLAAAVVALSLTVGGLALLGFSYERYYAGRIYPGVTILGQAMGGQTYAAARDNVAVRANQLLDQALVLERAHQGKETVTPRSIGFDLNADSLVYEAYQRGRTGAVVDRWWELVLLKTSGAAFAFAPTIDADHILARLEEKLVTYEQPVKDASLRVSRAGVEIVPAQDGIRVDRADVARQIEEILEALALPATITITTETIPAKVSSDDLLPLVDVSRRLTSQPVTLVAGDRRFTVDSETLLSWLSYDPTATAEQAVGHFAWNEELLTGYLQGIAKKVDVPMRPKKLNVHTGAVLEEGAVGSRLNRNQAVAALTQILEARGPADQRTGLVSRVADLQVDEVAIEETTVTPPFTPGLYEGKYVEVNLSEQTLYQWEGSNLLASYPVSTGKWSSPTPQGVLYIKNHISYAYSRKYDLYMPWWLGLAWNPDGSGYEGYGIHELPEWKNGTKEGQSHLGTPVSHGCIRLGIGPAEAMYSWAEEGMPVYIHK